MIVSRRCPPVRATKVSFSLPKFNRYNEQVRSIAAAANSQMVLDRAWA